MCNLCRFGQRVLVGVVSFGEMDCGAGQNSRYLIRISPILERYAKGAAAQVWDYIKITWLQLPRLQRWRCKVLFFTAMLILFYTKHNLSSIVKMLGALYNYLQTAWNCASIYSTRLESLSFYDMTFSCNDEYLNNFDSNYYRLLFIASLFGDFLSVIYYVHY